MLQVMRPQLIAELQKQDLLATKLRGLLSKAESGTLAALPLPTSGLAAAMTATSSATSDWRLAQLQREVRCFLTISLF
jgi:hypothetical protein